MEMLNQTLDEHLAGRSLTDLSDQDLRNLIAHVSVADANKVRYELGRREEGSRRIEIVGANVPMGHLAALIFKASIASIPTALFWLVIAGVLRLMSLQIAGP